MSNKFISMEIASKALLSPLWLFFIILSSGLHRALVMDGITPDAVHYMDMARNLAAGEGLTTYILNLGSDLIPASNSIFQPLFPAALALSARITGSQSFEAIQLISRIFSSALFFSSLFLFFSAIRKISDRLTSILALSFIAVNYNFLKLPSWILSENLYIFFLSLFCWVFLKKEWQDKMLFTPLLSFLGACLFFTRFAGISAICAVLLFYLIIALRKKSLRGSSSCVRKIFSLLAFFSLFSGLGAALLSFAQYSMQHRPPYSGNFFHILYLIGFHTVNNFFSFSFCALFWIPAFVGLIYLLYRTFRRKAFYFSCEVFKTDMHLFFALYLIIYSSILLFMSLRVDVTLGIQRFVQVNLPLIVLFPASFILALCGNDSGFRKKTVSFFVFLSIVVFVRQAVKYTALYPSRVSTFENRKAELCKEEPKYEWMLSRSIGPGDLVIGQGAFLYRFYFNCMVIESGYPEHPQIEYDTLINFLQKMAVCFKTSGIKRVFLIVKKTYKDIPGQDDPFSQALLKKEGSFADLEFDSETADACFYKYSEKLQP